MTTLKPTLTFLPMEDIAGDLVENKKLATQQMLNKSIEDAGKKFAASDSNGVANDSAKLNGKGAEEYLTKDDSARILGTTDSMCQIYSDEIRNLRDEVYQLKNQLSQSGYINEHGAYEGFYDSFKNNDKKYETKICGISESIPLLTDTLTIDDVSKIKDFEKGKHFVILNTETKQKEIVTVKSCSALGNVEFYPSTALLGNKDVIELHKSAGNYIRNSFSFSDISSGLDYNTQERYHMQSDDTMTAGKIINKSHTGYAASFKIPASCVPNEKAALLNFSITAKANGNPGDLICYLIEESAGFTNGILSPVFTSVEDAKEKGLVVATSQPVKAENAVNMSTLSFNFYNKTTSAYPIINPKRYIFLIESINADEENYWTIYFSYYRNEANEIEDLEKYNTSLKYTCLDSSDTSGKALSTIDEIDKYDLIFTLAAKDVLEKTEVGENEGLYTAKIILPKPIDISRARLTSRINREGCYYVKSFNDNYTKFTLAKEDEYAYSSTDLRFDEGDTIIIGNQIGTVKTCTSDTVTLNEPLYLDYRQEKLYTKNNSSVKIPVYRMNYEVSLKPYLVNWEDFDLDKKEFKAQPLDENVFKMPLKGVMPVLDNAVGSRVSDRLLFEIDFGTNDNDLSKTANEIELQIKWKSKFLKTEINKTENIQNGFNELIGRIHEIILTFDKAY